VRNITHRATREGRCKGKGKALQCSTDGGEKKVGNHSPGVTAGKRGGSRSFREDEVEKKVTRRNGQKRKRGTRCRGVNIKARLLKNEKGEGKRLPRQNRQEPRSKASEKKSQTPLFNSSRGRLLEHTVCWGFPRLEKGESPAEKKKREGSIEKKKKRFLQHAGRTILWGGLTHKRGGGSRVLLAVRRRGLGPLGALVSWEKGKKRGSSNLCAEGCGSIEKKTSGVVRRRVGRKGSSTKRRTWRGQRIVGARIWSTQRAQGTSKRKANKAKEGKKEVH